jgi:hypothetical protein
MRLAQCMTPDDLPINELQGAIAQIQSDSEKFRKRALRYGTVNPRSLTTAVE